MKQEPESRRGGESKKQWRGQHGGGLVQKNRKFRESEDMTEMEVDKSVIAEGEISWVDEIERSWTKQLESCKCFLQECWDLLGWWQELARREAGTSCQSVEMTSLMGK